MENIQTKTPIQRSSSWYVKLFRRVIKLQGFKHLAFNLGLRGFNRIQTEHFKFVGENYLSRKLRSDEIILDHSDNENIPVGHQWIYKKPQLGFVYNSRVDKGAAQQASLMSGSSLGSISSPLPGIYIALSTSSLTPAKGDTTLSGETSVAGLGRAVGAVQNYVAPSTLDGAASYDVFKSFTLTGTGTTVVSSALFDAVSTGNMFCEANFATSATMATNDILQVTWTVNL